MPNAVRLMVVVAENLRAASYPCPDRPRRSFHVQYHGLRHSMQRQVSIHNQPVAALCYARAGKSRGWKLRDVKEIWSLQVIVTCLFTCVYRGNVDRGLHS